jgi:hypothetical protein
MSGCKMLFLYLFFPDYHQLVEIVTQRPLYAGMGSGTKLSEQDRNGKSEVL